MYLVLVAIATPDGSSQSIWGAGSPVAIQEKEAADPIAALTFTGVVVKVGGAVGGAREGEGRGR